MKYRSLGLSLLLISCGGGGANAPVESAPEVVASPPANAPVEGPGPDGDPPAVQPVAEPAKEVPCGDNVCKAPEECIDVVGRQPDSARKECWVPCGKDGACPEGMGCTMIHDGPGRVCRKKTD